MYTDTTSKPASACTVRSPSAGSGRAGRIDPKSSGGPPGAAGTIGTDSGSPAGAGTSSGAAATSAAGTDSTPDAAPDDEPATTGAGAPSHPTSAHTTPSARQLRPRDIARADNRGPPAPVKPAPPDPRATLPACARPLTPPARAAASACG